MPAEIFRGRWRFRKRITLPDGRKKDITGTPDIDTKGAAEALERITIETLLNPNYKPAVSVAATLTFEEFTKTFLELAAAKDKPGEQINKESVIRTNLKPFFGKLRLDEIKYANIQDYTTLRLKTLKHKTVKNHLSLLKRILSVAAKRGLIAAVPEFEQIKVPPTEVDYLTFSEADLLLAAAQGEWHVLFLFAIRTGLRLGELIELRWKDVDLDRGLVMVRRSHSKGETTLPKSGKGRDVPLTDPVIAALRSHKPATAKHEDLVFPRSPLVRHTPDSLKYQLRASLKAAGLRKINIHALRHTFASHLVMRGVALYTVQSLMGHVSPDTTMRYAHLAPSVKRDAVAALENCISVVSGGKTEAKAA